MAISSLLNNAATLRGGKSHKWYERLKNSIHIEMLPLVPGTINIYKHKYLYLQNLSKVI